MIKTRISGSFPAKAEFIAQNKVKIVLPDNTYIAFFSTNYNYLTTSNGDNHFIQLIESEFSMNMFAVPRPNFETGMRNINANLYLNGYEMMLCLVPDQDKMEERIRIGTKIRELRQKQKIDAKTLALRAGIDASNLSRIEQGHYSVGLDILAKIANALNAHIELVENSQ